jgi:hypothetical protein
VYKGSFIRRCTEEVIQRNVLKVVLYTGLNPACEGFRTVSPCASAQACSLLLNTMAYMLDITCTTAMGVITPVSCIAALQYHCHQYQARVIWSSSVLETPIKNWAKYGARK